MEVKKNMPIPLSLAGLDAKTPYHLVLDAGIALLDVPVHTLMHQGFAVARDDAQRMGATRGSSLVARYTHPYPTVQLHINVVETALQANVQLIMRRPVNDFTKGVRYRMTRGSSYPLAITNVAVAASTSGEEEPIVYVIEWPILRGFRAPFKDKQELVYPLVFEGLLENFLICNPGEES